MIPVGSTKGLQGRIALSVIAVVIAIGLVAAGFNTPAEFQVTLERCTTAVLTGCLVAIVIVLVLRVNPAQRYGLAIVFIIEGLALAFLRRTTPGDVVRNLSFGVGGAAGAVLGTRIRTAIANRGINQS